MRETFFLMAIVIIRAWPADIVMRWITMILDDASVNNTSGSQITQRSWDGVCRPSYRYCLYVR